MAYRRPCRLYAAREHEWLSGEIRALELLLGTMLAVITRSGIGSGICRNLFAATGLADIVLYGSVYSARVPLGKDPAPIPDEEIEVVKAVLIISGGYLRASCGRLSGKQLRWPVKNPC